MAKGSFYRYVTDKADLVAQIMTPVASEVTAALDRCDRALAEAAPTAAVATIYLTLATELAAILAAHAPRVLLYLQEARAPGDDARRAIHALAEELTALTIALTRRARAGGLIRDVDPASPRSPCSARSRRCCSRSSAVVACRSARSRRRPPSS